MVAVIIGCRKGVGMLWISNGSVKIDNAVECAASADPIVDLQSNCFALFGIVSCTAIRCECAANDRNAMRMRTNDNLIEHKNEVFRGRLVRVGFQIANVVDPFENDQELHPALR